MSSTESARAPGLRPIAVLALAIVMLAAGLVASLAVRKPGAVGRAAGGEEQLERIQWRLPVAFPTTLPALGDTPTHLARALREASAGNIALTVFEPGMLVPAFSITEAVRDRKVEVGFTWLGYDQGRIPSAPLFSAVPFGMEPWEFMTWWFEAGGEALAQEVYGKQGAHVLLCGLTGPETAGWFRNEIRSVEDLRGLKIRFAGLGGQVMQRLGASVTVLPGGEIFPALERGAIDATEFALPSVDQTLGFDRLVRNNYFPGWHQTFTSFHLVVNKEIWDGLAAPTRAMLRTACTEQTVRNLTRGEAAQGPVVASFQSRGVQTRRLPDPVLRELQRVSNEVMEAEAGRDADFRRVYASQTAFRAAYAPWRTLGYLPRDF